MPTPGRSLRRLTVPLSAVALTMAAAAPALAAGSSDNSFIPGSATGVAQAIRVAPATAGLAYTVTLGTSVAGYDDSQGKAQAQTLDLGVIGTTLTGEGCDGSAPPLKQSQLPQPVIAEAGDGQDKSTKSETTAGGKGMPGAVGTATATATSQPSGAASTKGVTLDVPGLITVSGATTASTARLLTGKARVADADAAIGQVSLLGGQVVLGNLQWHAEQRTGQGKAASGRFTIGSLTIAGKPQQLSSDSLATALGAVNKALKPSGLQLTLPSVAKADDGTVQVGPLVLGMADSQVGQQVVAPVLSGAQPVRDALFKALTGFSCKFSTLFLLGDIASGPASGAGSLRVLLGGVSAGSEGTRYANPFGSFDLGASAVSSGFGSGSSAAVGSGSAAAGLGGSLPAGGAQTGSGDAGVAPTIAGRPVVESRSCSTTHPGGGGCSPRAALPVGLGALGAVLLVGLADLLLGGGGRRRRLPQLQL